MLTMTAANSPSVDMTAIWADAPQNDPCFRAAPSDSARFESMVQLVSRVSGPIALIVSVGLGAALVF